MHAEMAKILERLVGALLAPPPRGLCPRCARECYTPILREVQQVLEGITLPATLQAELFAWLRVANQLVQYGWSYPVAMELLQSESALYRYTRDPRLLVNLLESEVSYLAAPYWARALKEVAKDGTATATAP